MTIEQAVQHLRPIMWSASLPHYKQALKLVLKTAEAQMPKEAKPKGRTLLCPECGAVVALAHEGYRPNFCEICGQAIEYPKEEEGEINLDKSESD